MLAANDASASPLTWPTEIRGFPDLFPREQSSSSTSRYCGRSLLLLESKVPNHTFERTVRKLRLRVPSSLRLSVAADRER